MVPFCKMGHISKTVPFIWRTILYTYIGITKVSYVILIFYKNNYVAIDSMTIVNLIRFVMKSEYRKIMVMFTF